jgi:hypothetical protein
MSKKRVRALLSKLWPYVHGIKQRLALFVVMLLLILSPLDFDSVHLHVDSAPSEPTVNVSLFASGNSTATVTRFSSFGNF